MAVFACSNHVPSYEILREACVTKGIKADKKLTPAGRVTYACRVDGPTGGIVRYHTRPLITKESATDDGNALRLLHFCG